MPSSPFRHLELEEPRREVLPLPTKWPILLVHGIFPFHRLLQPALGGDNSRNDRFHYFRKIRSTLMQEGYAVFHTRVSWGGPLEQRAADLRNELIRITRNFTRWPRVHILAHSMGGLDARCMLHRFRMEDRVVTLTTIGTPHWGSPYADRGMKRFSSLMHLGRALGVHLEGARDLTRDACARFNERTSAYEEQNGVQYRTLAGVQPLERVFLPLRRSWRIIFDEEGENDGLVSRTSAVWKTACHLETMDADHLNEIGWWDRGEARTGKDRETFEAGIRAVYLRVAQGLPD
jgi:triacylglycerol lipase